jgi:hypothetical protein
MELGLEARGFQSLSNETLLNVLAYLDPTPEIRIIDRAWVSVESVESFTLRPTQDENAAKYVAHFRLTCKKFSAVGIKHQFKTVTTPFSLAGFTRLQTIARQPHIATEVQKFSYKVPRVYLNGRPTFRQAVSKLLY